MAFFERNHRQATIFEDCPDDTLFDIVSRLHRSEDLASLSLGCLRLHGLVAPFLNDCKLLRRVTVLHTGSPSRLEGLRLHSGTPLSLKRILFHPIVERPELCRYVVSVRVEFDYDDHYRLVEMPMLYMLARKERSDSRETEVLESLDSRAKEILKRERLKETEFLERALKEMGISACDDEGKALYSISSKTFEWRESPSVALFLLSLSNMEKLHIERCGPYDWIDWAIRELVLSQPPPARAGLKLGFHDLREVTIENQSTEHYTDFHHVTPFLLLPSIQKISAGNVLQDENFVWDREYGLSTVTELSFRHSIICLEALEKMLLITKALGHFRYECGGTHSECRPDVYEAYKRRTILNVVKRTQNGLDMANIVILKVNPK